ncbi:hypothetical protein CMQ_1734 [Grosmannia clavigera kw1407]|uniref:Uncharacterized protein n=1 Tax=Grosmannia clavigera (strain kw1407 / UAMH 11150) TaxID=655863 RepID=F0XE69_GROCL|nr:uncharacterized protein CMQ_1734 [Grosmannia clavigera kw1407]EFX04806.1 hypothetical protein CMQ_1734 [Grosmannia clavigera kw1407]
MHVTWTGLLAASAALVAPISAQADMPLSSPLQAILDGASANPLFTYPTRLTQGIVPRAVHSHNDYWRPAPFYSALAAGAVSIEADVWLYNGTLHVGHEQSALTAARTFASLYVEPILAVLRAQNPNSSYVSSLPTRNGVFDTASGQTLYLFVDVKTDGPSTWPYVVEALAPLRRAGYLTRVNGSAVIAGPVTVIGTGNTPLNLVQGVTLRDYFYDAPIPYLDSTFANITADVSPIASTDFAVQFGTVLGQTFNDSQLVRLRKQVRVAHSKGIKVRYWDQPGWPVGTRNAIWRTLWDNGVDLLNVDDLEAVADFWENEG